jgi:hypothetical protein
MAFVRVLFGNQVLSGGDEVIENILFFLEHPRPVPVFAKFRTSAQVG